MNEPKITLADIIRVPKPNEEALRTSYGLKADAIRPAFIDNWPPEILALSMPTTLVPVDKGLAKDLFEPERLDGRRADADELVRQIDAVCGWDRKFFRLNSRSPKDWPWPFEVPISCSGREMLLVIAASERCLDDIVMFNHIDDPLFICLRDVEPIRPDEELRCFVKNGELLAVAQYGFEPILATEKDRAAVRARVDRFFAETLKPRLHVDTVVFDLWMARPEPMLIELNPFGFSDPVGAGTYEAIEAGIPGIALRQEAA